PGPEVNSESLASSQADGERLPSADSSFDRVWGNAILHHLDTATAAYELHRVLGPEGVAVFCEPWGGNPLLHLARCHLPYPGKQRTPDEQPLRWRDVAILRRGFGSVELQGFQLLSMMRRVLSASRVVTGLERCDRLLLAGVPGLQHFSRYVVLTLRDDCTASRMSV